jgi:IS5 family transposase
MVSPIDPDARYGVKSERKRFVGYKANIAETVESRFITNIKAMRGNMHDGKNAIGTIVEQKELGILPSKVIGDTAYGEANNRKVLHEHGTELVSPLGMRNTRTRAVYPKSMFRYDQKRKTLTCPQGVTTKMSYLDRKKGLTMYHFPMSRCNQCPVQKECTNDSDGRRTVGMSPLYSELRKAEQYNQTEQFKKDMKLRPPIEGKVSELTRYHGMRRSRYRGLKKVGLQFYFTAAAVNIKRCVRLVLARIKPKVMQLSPA